MKKINRRVAFTAAAMIASLGVVALPAAAEADTGWTWRVGTSSQR